MNTKLIYATKRLICIVCYTFYSPLTKIIFRAVGCLMMDGWSSVLRPRQHSIGYMGDGFYRSKDPNQQHQSTEGTHTVHQ